MEIEKTVINNIKRIRKEKGISQEKLAEYCETSTSYIGLMETYKNIPKLQTIQRIANVLNVPISRLLTDDIDSEIPTLNEDLKKGIKKELMESISVKIDEILNRL